MNLPSQAIHRTPGMLSENSIILWRNSQKPRINNPIYITGATPTPRLRNLAAKHDSEQHLNQEQ